MLCPFSLQCLTCSDGFGDGWEGDYNLYLAHVAGRRGWPMSPRLIYYKSVIPYTHTFQPIDDSYILCVFVRRDVYQYLITLSLLNELRQLGISHLWSVGLLQQSVSQYSIVIIFIYFCFWYDTKYSILVKGITMTLLGKGIRHNVFSDK